MVSPNKDTAKPSPNKKRHNSSQGTSKGRQDIKQEADEDDKKGWTPHRVEILIECLEKAKSLVTGNVAGRNFTPKLAQIAAAVRRETGHDFNDKQVKNYWIRLKRLHAAFQKCMKQTGVTVDLEQGLVNAEDQTWEDVLLPLSYAEVKSIRKNGFPLFVRVDALIGDTRATGSRRHPSCISPSGSDSSDDPIMEIKQDMSEMSMKSGEKRKTVAYDQGGSSSGKKKKTNISIAQSVSELAHSLTVTRSGSTHEGLSLQQMTRTQQLQKALEKATDLQLADEEFGKLCMYFNDQNTGWTWVETFLKLPDEKWKGVLNTLPQVKQ